MNLDGSTQIVGVFGAPITHTASPAMHNAAFKALKMNWAYLAFHVEPQNLRAALTGICAMNLRGVNLTVPHKILALDFVDDVDPEARRLGAVNVVVAEAGRLRGFNTDGYGFSKAIREEFNLKLKGCRVLVLGAGGAGRAIAAQCQLEGAAKVVLANRTPGRVPSTISLNASNIRQLSRDVDLIVNATSVGLRKEDSLGLPADCFSPKQAVYDIIYHFPETEFLRQASAAGAKTANGLSMLLHQGAKAFELWTKRKAPITVMRRALRAAVYGERA
jgi:shikimate dehydrogenase